MVSHVWLFVTLWTAVHQILLSLGFPRQEYCSELSFPPPGNLPESGIEPAPSALACGFFTTGTTSEALLSYPMVTNIKLPNLSIFQQEKFVSQSPFMYFIGQMQFYSLSSPFWEQSTRNRQFLRLRAEGKWKRKTHMPHEGSESFCSENGTWHFRWKFIGQTKLHAWVWCPWVEKYNNSPGMDDSAMRFQARLRATNIITIQFITYGLSSIKLS